MSSDLSFSSFCWLLVAIGSTTLILGLFAMRNIKRNASNWFESMFNEWTIMIAIAFALPLAASLWIVLGKNYYSNHYSYWEILWIVLLMLPTAFAISIIVALWGMMILTTLLKLTRSKLIPSDCGGLAAYYTLLPFFTYSGWMAGAFLVAFLSGDIGHQPSSALGAALAYVIAVLGTSLLAGLMPAAILSIPELKVNYFGLPIAAIANALISASLGSRLPHWLWQLNALARSLPSGG